MWGDALLEESPDASPLSWGDTPSPESWGDTPEIDFVPDSPRRSLSKVKPDARQAAETAAGRKLDPYGARDADLITAVASNPIDFVKSIPAIATGVITAPGKLAYNASADALSKLFNDAEYGGNLASLMTHEDKTPAERFIGEAAKTNPNFATAAHIGKSVAEVSPLAVVGALPAGAGRLVAAGFSLDMISHAPELFQQYAEEINKPPDDRDAGKLAELKSGIIQTFTLAPLAGAHAAKASASVGGERVKLEVNEAELTRQTEQLAQVAPLTAEALKSTVLPEKPAPVEAPALEPSAAIIGEPTKPLPPETPPSEVAPPPAEAVPRSPTSIKNAQVDIERQKRGLPPAVEPARRSFGTVWDEAMAKIDHDPTTPDRLMNELRDKPRALTDVEDATLLQRQIELQNEYGKATEELAKAHDEGRVDAVGAEQGRVAELSNRLLDLYNINKKVGTETGRGLNARKMMADEDFSLAKMELEKRAANGGRPLTEAERSEITSLNKKIEATQKAYDEYVTASESRIAELEVKRALDEVERQAKTEPTIDPRITSLAERIVSSLETQAESARARLKQKFTQSTAGVDVTILGDLAVIGASHIARGTLEFSKWSTKMVEEFGEQVKPYLKDAFDAANKQVEKLSGKDAAKVRRAVAKQDQKEQGDAIGDAIKRKVEAGEKADIGPQAQKLAKMFVELGVKDRNELVDSVHAELQKYIPDITRREAMDAISGYGDFKQLTKDEISVQLRDLKGQLQQVGKLEDMQAGQAPQKTGVERRTPSDEERRLIKQVEESKKKGGYEVTDPATQLRSALQSIKTRLENQIADLQHEVSTKERIVREKTQQPTSPEVEALKTRRDELKAQRDGLFGKRELTDEQRIKIATAAVEKSIADYEQRIAKKDIGPRTTGTKTPPSVALEALRTRRDALKDQLQELRDLANPKKTPEELALQAFKTRTRNRIADIQDRLARGDFSKKPRRELKMDSEANRLHFEATKAKISWHEALMKDRLANRSIPEKILGNMAETLNTSRAILTSMDLSAVLRQGGFIALAHPIRASKSFPAMFRAFRSEAGQHAVNQEILARKNYPLYQRSKLYLSEHGQKLAQMEEAYMSRWADKIPLVAGSQRAYVTFLNKLRADSFDAMVNSLSRSGEVTPTEANAIANFINVATGRGKVGATENALVGLNTVFFAPRYVASRFQLIAGQPLYGGTARTRTLVAQEYARYLIGLGVVYGLAQIDGAEVEPDSRSSDFGKLKYGNTRLDPLSGLAQSTVLLSRLVTGETKTTDGKALPSRTVDTIGNFMRSKLAPFPGAALDTRELLLGQKTPHGHPKSLEEIPVNLATPLAFRDIYNAMQEQGVPRGTAFALLSLLGMSLQNHEEQQNK